MNKSFLVVARWVAVFLLVALLLPSVAAAEVTAPRPEWLWVYFGTYTKGESKGVYVAKLELKTGKLDGLQLAAEVTNPSFLALSPRNPHLYACGEVGGQGGTVSAFSIDERSGTLTKLNQQSSKGPGPCHVSVDSPGRNLLVANYSGGSVACLPIDADGKLGEATSFIQHEGKGADPKRQQGPHAHSVNLDRPGRFAFVADLGLDKIMSYRLDAEQGKLSPNDPPFVAVAPGAGPRHFAIHPGCRFAYVINELNSTITAFSFQAQAGKLEAIQSISTLPTGFEGSNWTAEVQVHPLGKFVYGSNRGHNSIAAFAVDQSTGKLTAIGHTSTEGKTPRNFAIDPTGTYLLAANQDSGNVVQFKIDGQTGKLAPTGRELKIANCVCVKFRWPAP